jgi:hypothetical protein
VHDWAVGSVLAHDLKQVVFGNVESLDQRRLDTLRNGAAKFRRFALRHVNAHERHGLISSAG